LPKNVFSSALRNWMQARAKDDIAPVDQVFVADSMTDDDKRRIEEAGRIEREKAQIVRTRRAQRCWGCCSPSPWRGSGGGYDFWQGHQPTATASQTTRAD
jgi:hypothetical protein